MPVLSFSDQCTAERSPTSKIILEEAPLMQINCSQKPPDSRHTLLDATPKARQNSNSCIQISKERDYDSTMLIDELHTAKHSHLGPLPSGQCSRNENEKKGGCREIGFQQKLDCHTSDANASFPHENIVKKEGEQSKIVQAHATSLLQCNGNGNYTDVEVEEKKSRSIANTLSGKDGSVIDKSIHSTSIPTEAENLHVVDVMQYETVQERMDMSSQTDSEQGNLSLQDQDNELSTSTSAENAENIGTDSQMHDCDQEGESSSQGVDYVEEDTVAFWVKWRGMWQTGFQCPRVDCPLQTLRAKPTHERKKYIAVFFPRKRRYNWTDLHLILPISEYPQPLASGTHRKWRKLVEDLTMPRRYIIQKLAVAILNISDQLHTEAIAEEARTVSTWIEFAKESSNCQDYSELGRMLVKLQTIILPNYFDNTWLESSFFSWKHRCQNATSAEAVEILTRELTNSVQWNKVEELFSAPVQPDLSLEWRTWKQEAMKYFPTSHPISNGFTNLRHRNYNTSAGMGTSQISNKLPEQDMCRAESSTSQMEEAAHCMDIVGHTSMSNAEPLNVQPISEVDPSFGSSSSRARATTPYQYRQCLAFIAAKERRCGRWATDGDDYCCVHMNSNAIDKIIQDKRSPHDAPMCEGTTTHGHSCKHRARLGSAFCKKHHRPTSHEGKLKRKNSDINYLENTYGTNNETAVKEFQSHTQKRLVPAPVDKNLDERVFLIRESDSRSALPPSTVGTSSTDAPLCIEYNVQNDVKHSLEVAPMCGGVTIHGLSCKHRAQPGSNFCKKHGHDLSSSSGNKLKRKLVDIPSLGNISSSGASDIKDHENYMQKKQALVPVNDIVEKRQLVQECDLHSTLPITVESSDARVQHCIGYYSQSSRQQCVENANKHTLYCDKHIPRFLKRARDGKSRLVSKDVFVNLLQDCVSREQKLYLHQACELLYDFMKRSLSYQTSNMKSDIMDWVMSEVSKNVNVGEYLLKLVLCEKEKITRLWGINTDKVSSGLPTLETQDEKIDYTGTAIKCKLCAAHLTDDQTLGAHWRDIHKKEARWLFRGYACGVCMDSFTNRKVLKSHVRERHGIQFIEHSILLRCMSCNGQYLNLEQLWQHILSSHLSDLRMPNHSQQTQQSVDQFDQKKIESNHNNIISLKENASQRYTCRYCGLKFDLLPDIGRHHQVAHMSSSSLNQFRSNRYIKHNRLSHPRFKKSFGATYRFKNQASFGMQKRFPSSNLILSMRPQAKDHESDTLGRLLDSHCSTVAETLFSEMQKTKPRPSNQEILSIARTACCQIGLHAALDAKYGSLPKNMYLKAAKLCSELNIEVGWHVEGFICPKGCKPMSASDSLSPMTFTEETLDAAESNFAKDTQWMMDESHYILYPQDFNWETTHKSIVLCPDVSFGKESVPVTCVVDENLKDMVNSSFLPWNIFKYTTKRLVEPSLGLDVEDSQLGCTCPAVKCSPEKCDHVYLFNNDYENAEDIYNKPMHGRFPYDEKGRIILQQGCLVYECNSLCKCGASCQNRILQRGVHVKLEIFKTEKKGWGVRAREPISRGTFVCEYIGQVQNDEDGTKRAKRFDNGENSYIYDMNAHGSMAVFNKEIMPCVINATEFGNVSRFLNHSCSPNLVNYMVLVESMDYQLAHIGLFANQDIARGEELSYDYHYEVLPGEGYPCYCEAPNCRGRLY